MRIYRLQDVKQTRKLQPGRILAGIAILSVLALIIFGYASVYTIQQGNEALSEELQALEEEKRSLQKRIPGETVIRTMAEALGMTTLNPWDVVILHLDED